MPNVPKAPLPGAPAASYGGGIRVPTSAPIGAFGGGEDEARAFGESNALAQEASGIFRKHLEEAIDSETADNLAKLSAEETRLKTELQNVRGKDALTAQQKTLSDFDKFHGDMTNQIANPVVKQQMAKHYQQFKTSLGAWGSQYANGQFRQYQDESDMALIRSEQDAVRKDLSDYRVVEATDRQNAALTNFAQRNGKSPEWLDLQKKIHTSATYANVIDQLSANGDDLTARKYYDLHKDMLWGEDAQRLAKTTELGSVRGEAQREADRIISEIVPGDALAGPAGGMGLRMANRPRTEREALVEAAKIQNPAVREHTEQRLLHSFQIQDRLEREQREGSYKQSYNALTKNGGDLASLPSGVLESYPPNLQESLEHHAYNVRTGRQPAPNGQAYYDLRQMAASEGSRQEFIDRNLVADAHRMTNTELGHLMELQASMRAKDGKADEENTGFLTEQGMVEAVAAGKFHKDAPEHALFKMVASAELERIKKELKVKTLPDAKVREVADKLMLEVVTNPRWSRFWKPWESTAPVYQVLEGNRKEALQVPEVDRQRIIQQFKGMKAVPTDAEILDTYRLELKKKAENAAPK